MQMTLARMGIQTHVAYRLAQAKQLLAEHQYDACLTDLNLPDGNGLQLVEWISEQYPECTCCRIDRLRQYGYCDCCFKSRCI